MSIATKASEKLQQVLFNNLIKQWAHCAARRLALDGKSIAGKFARILIICADENLNLNVGLIIVGALCDDETLESAQLCHIN